MEIRFLEQQTSFRDAQKLLEAEKTLNVNDKVRRYLVAHEGRIVTYEQLAYLIYNGDIYESLEHNSVMAYIRVVVYKVRKMLEDFGTITSVKGIGYRYDKTYPDGNE